MFRGYLDQNLYGSQTRFRWVNALIKKMGVMWFFNNAIHKQNDADL